MLPPQWRLSSPTVFRLVYQRGRRYRTAGFTWWALAQLPENHTRLGVVVSSRVAKRATERNLYKRRLWAILAEFKDKIPNFGYYFVVVASPGISRCSYSELKRELAGIVK